MHSVHRYTQLYNLIYKLIRQHVSAYLNSRPYDGLKDKLKHVDKFNRSHSVVLYQYSTLIVRQ